MNLLARFFALFATIVTVRTGTCAPNVAHDRAQPKPIAVPKKTKTSLRIPVLNWTERSDWTNVKTDLTPRAVGDGVADDTAALQAALSGIKDGSVIYLPAGTFRITDTLHVKIDRDPNLGPAHRAVGVTIIGHGRDTKITWDGPEGKDMLVVSGLTHSRYEGFVMDGQNKATIGLNHFGQEGTFETEVGHRNLEFYNFTDAGIYAQVPPATSEATIENCLFGNCKRGVAILNWNEYDYTFDGCEFQKCETAIDVQHGNTYIRNCHFEGSKVVDVALNPEHGCSLRRCTSHASKQFIQYINPVAPLSVQDCQVSSWTNPDGAIVIGGAPAVIFDTVFTNPPGKSPPIQIIDNLKVFNRPGQRLFHSQCISKDTDGLYTPKLGVVYEIPAGKRKASLTSANQHFIVDTQATPPKVFDAKADFGAMGDGKADDTAAIQKAIDAARTYGKNAIAYLPTGNYYVSKTLKITGANYSVGGTGRRTNILWRGAEDGTIIEVNNPQKVTLENIAVGNSDTGLESKNAYDISQISTGEAASSITYDNVTVYGSYAKDPFHKGLWLRGLNKKSTVNMRHEQGNLRIVDSARATLLLGVTYEGSVVVEGKSKQRDGFLGLMSHLGTICEHPLYVKDNHSLVASDFYIEQSNQGFSFEGSADDPPGRITIASPKLSMGYDANDTNRFAALIKGYHGQINLGPTLYYIDPVAMNFSHTGADPVTVLVWGGIFYNTHMIVKKEDAAHFVVTGCIGVAAGDLTGIEVQDTLSPDTLAQLSAALDDLRELGEWDLKINHPEVVNG